MLDMLNKTASIPQSMPPIVDSETNKYITFGLLDYFFALPSEKVLRIVATPSPSQGGLVTMGLVQLGQYSIQTIDLPQLLNLQNSKTDNSNSAGSQDSHAEVPIEPAEQVESPKKSVSIQNPPFLIVLQDSALKLWGIAVDEPPDLMDIPHYALKPVPSEKRLTRALRWVSDIVTYDLEGDRHTLLVLDLSMLLSPDKNDASSANPSSLEIEPPLEASLEIEEDLTRKEEMYA